jgi:hypothetical protein
LAGRASSFLIDPDLIGLVTCVTTQDGSPAIASAACCL